MRTRLQVVLAAVATVLGLGVALPGLASAAVDSGTSTAVTGGFSDLKTFIVVTIGVLFFALVVAIIGMTTGAKWLKRGASK